MKLRNTIQLTNDTVTQCPNAAIEEPPITLTIREIAKDLRLYITDEFALLECYGKPVATKKDGAYFVASGALVELSDGDITSNSVKDFLGDCDNYSIRPAKIFKGAYDRLDHSNVLRLDYSMRSSEFWNV